MSTTVSTKALLESWLVIEFLSSGNEIDRDTCFSLNPGQYTRELEAHHKGSKIFLGIFPAAAVQERLATLFTDPDFQEVSTGSGYVAELTITRDGALLADSIALSSLPWAINQLERRTELVNWDGQFRQFTADLAGELGEFFRVDDESDLITRIERANRHLIQRFGWESICRPDLFFRPVGKEGEAESGVINSFFATDLSRLLTSDTDNIGPALQQYMRRQPTQPRVDIRRNPELIQQLTLASQLPEGSWPSPYALSLMQQVAVTYSVNELSNKPGLFSVNGPPGTGKTTLLKDVFAAIIVGRARKLATYQTPADAFTPTGEQIRISDGYKPEWYRLAADLADDAIVVASSNNTAVENLTKEIPLPDAGFIEAYGAYPPTVYFPEIGQLLTDNPSAWNGLAVALGKGENKAHFATNWFDADDRQGGRRAGIQSLIKRTNYTPTDWRQAVADFNKALTAFDSLKQRAAQAEAMVQDDQLVKLLTTNQFDLSLAHRTVADKSTQLQNELTESQAQLTENTITFQLVQAQKPAFWHFWFGLKAAQTYKAGVAAVATQRRTLQNRIAQLQTQQQVNAHHASLLAGLTRIRAEFGAATPDPIYWHSAATDNPSAAQEQAPWLAKPVKEASVAVFLAALRVQQVFVGLAQKPLLANISVLVGHLGKGPLREGVLSAVWNTLFLLTPVVSTTFAAAGRLFGGLGRETFGWLFIDEAGQAVPQAAVGTLWRCKRAIIIGDPTQIEPVVSLPEKVFEYVRTRKRIAPDWVGSCESVQTFGDAANYIGTQLPTGQWIGSPLKVHRRCLEPMFSLANEIAYDNIMQNANRTRQPADWGIGSSRFIQVTGFCTDKQWVPEQGQAALEIIRAYQARQQPGEAFSLFVITPFRAVATHFWQMLPPDLKPKLAGRIGTVHTFQGKEADIVLFLLGCDANRLAALRWADAKPNLLNVALTRAKQQFMAIGDRRLLTGTTHFSVMLTWLGEYERQYSDAKNLAQRR